MQESCSIYTYRKYQMGLPAMKMVFRLASSHSDTQQEQHTSELHTAQASPSTSLTARRRGACCT
jgi:hypothetical protein